MDGPDLVFAYGSLLDHASGRPCTLHGWRRGWGVAMDNRRTLPGYRYFVDRETGERPAVFVTFLDISEHPGARVQGMAFAADLELLDARERNYTRVDVTDLTDAGARGRVWAYTGLTEARERCAAARRAGTAVVWDEYVARVRAGFDGHGFDFDRSTDPLDLPVRALREVRIP